MLDELSRGSKVVGAKQVRRALETGTVKTVYLAADADPQLTDAIAELCRERDIPTETVDSMKALGRACGISVGAAVAARFG